MQAVNASPYHIHPIHSVLYRLPGKTIVLEKVNSADVSEGYASQNQRASSASQGQQCIDSFSLVPKKHRETRNAQDASKLADVAQPFVSEDAVI